MKVDTTEKGIIFFQSFTYPQISLDIPFKIYSNLNPQFLVIQQHQLKSF